MSSSPSRISGPSAGVDPAPKPTRRSFPAEYKLRILAGNDSAPGR